MSGLRRAGGSRSAGALLGLGGALCAGAAVAWWWRDTGQGPVTPLTSGPASGPAGEASEVDYFGPLREKLVGFDTLFLVASHSGWSSGPLSWDGRIRGELDGSRFMIYVDRRHRITADGLSTYAPGRYFWDGKQLLGWNSDLYHHGPLPEATAMLAPFLEEAWAGFPDASVEPANPQDYGFSGRLDPWRPWVRLVTNAKWVGDATVLLQFGKRTGDLTKIAIAGPSMPVPSHDGLFTIDIESFSVDEPIPAWDVEAGLTEAEDWFVPGPPKRLWYLEGEERIPEL